MNLYKTPELFSGLGGMSNHSFNPLWFTSIDKNYKNIIYLW